MNPAVYKKLYDNWVDYVRNCLKGCPDESDHVAYLMGYGRCLVHLASYVFDSSVSHRYSGWVSHWVRRLEDRYDVSPIGICSAKENAETDAYIKEHGYGA